MRSNFALRSRRRDGEPFQYTACGLDDVYLMNGFALSQVDEEPAVSIENMDDLHRAIGLNLVTNRKRLRPKEVRFLRRELDMTQNELAQLLGTTDQAVARWEKGKTPISGPADRLLRLLFVIHCLTPEQRERLIGELEKHLLDLQELDENSVAPTFFRQSKSRWRPRAQPD